jgi:glycosyltransferase involved in cell wall biosynthesis
MTSSSLSRVVDLKVMAASCISHSMLCMKILIISDAWRPQVNGVVRTLENTQVELAAMGHEVVVLGPDRFRSIPLPGYREIRVAVRPARTMARVIEAFEPDCLHIATEGPLGIAAGHWCRHNNAPFTTSCHTQFPEYLRLRAPVPTQWTYCWLRRFHSFAFRTMVRSRSQMKSLQERGFRNLVLWPGGVDTQLFRPRTKRVLDLPRPIALYAGRVAPEKTIEDFLAVELPGSKVVIGDGPARADLEKRFPHAHFLGYKFGEDLARHVASSDVFVFPSRTDTLGLVMLEAMASGVPVAAYPVDGPLDVVLDGLNGSLNWDLGAAIKSALRLDRSKCHAFASTFSWRHCTQVFLEQLQPVTVSPPSVPGPSLAA